MLTKRLVFMGVYSATMLVMTLSTTYGQTFPNRPIRFVGQASGGPSDTVARITASLLSESLGQQVIVDSRSSVILGGEIVARALPDGHTLLFPGSSMWTGSVFSRLPFDPQKDFEPISMVSNSVLMVVVHPKVPINSVKELIAFARAKPGQLNMACGTISSSSAVASLLFKSMTGVNIVNIYYKGIPPGIIDLLAGEAQVSIPSTGAVIQHVKQGRLRGLATTGAKRSALAPDLPTVAESGVPGYETGTANGLFAPAKTPKAIIARINQEVVRGLNRPDVKEKFLTAGTEAVGSTPEEFAAKMRDEIARLTKLFKEYPDIAPKD